MTSECPFMKECDYGYSNERSAREVVIPRGGVGRLYILKSHLVLVV